MREKIFVILILLIIFSLFISPPQISATMVTPPETELLPFDDLEHLETVYDQYQLEYGLLIEGRGIMYSPPGIPVPVKADAYKEAIFIENFGYSQLIFRLSFEGGKNYIGGDIDLIIDGGLENVEVNNIPNSSLNLYNNIGELVASDTYTGEGPYRLIAQAPDPTVVYAEFSASGLGNFYLDNLTFGIVGVTPVPEPATMLLFGSLLIGFVGVGYKKKFTL